MGFPSDHPSAFEDAHAQFLIAVGDLCLAAEVGGLSVELLTGGGRSTAGVPAWVDRAPRDVADDTGYGRTFRVSGQLVKLSEVVACTIRAPQARSP